MQQLARRVTERRSEFERRNDGQRVPITSAMSRILEHDPSYEPYRPRRVDRATVRPYVNPGIFTLQEIAEALGTTVGDLLGEPGPHAAKDTLSQDDRRTLRRLFMAVWRLLDLGDPALATKVPDGRMALQ